MAINPFFNAEYYLATNLDLLRAGLTTDEQLWDHYVTYGAQEALANTASNNNSNALREPNPWFNIDYYMQANPDLNQAGLTAADALNHYYEYGIKEGREFSSTVSIADFDAQTYAAENADLREAFGIEEDADLTAAQVDTLFQHYLAYGYAEGRKGAGEIGNLVQADNLPDGLTGTIMNDKFVIGTDGIQANVAGATIDGLGGTDTVVFAEGAVTGSTDGEVKPVTLKNVEKVVVGKDFNSSVEFSSKQAIETLTVEKGATFSETGAVTANAQVDQIVNSAANATVNLTTGQAEVNLTANAATNLFANNIKGNDLTVNVDGGAEDAGVTVGSNGSPTLTTVTIDGSAAKGDLELVADETLSKVKNVVMKGGAGDDTFTNTDGVTVATNFTADGGAGDDTFNASAAIDTFTGGAGNDEFNFSADTAKVRLDSKGEKVEAVDTITDFRAGDKLTVGEETTLTIAKFATGTLPAGATLEDALTTEVEDGGLVKAGSIFQWGDDAYVVLKNSETIDADTAMVKLAGVDVNKFVGADGNITADADGFFSFA